MQNCQYILSFTYVHQTVSSLVKIWEKVMLVDWLDQLNTDHLIFMYIV